MDAADVIAERQALAIALAYPTEARETFEAIPVNGWTDWRYADIARAVRSMLTAGRPIDGQSIVVAVVDTARRDEAHKVDDLSRTVIDLLTDAPPLTSLPFYVDRIRSLAVLRSAYDAATLFRQRIEEIARNRDDINYPRALAEMRQATEDAETAFESVAPTPPMSLAEMLDAKQDYDWLVPNLLERTDRLVLTGHEGRGKSELVSQFAATIAAGLHPFTGDPLPDRGHPYKVLVVDAENSFSQLQRRYQRISRMVDALCERHGMPAGDWTRFRQRMVLRPDGIELTNPRELSRITQAVELSEPDVLVIGPLYKLTDVDVTDAQGAKALVTTLDRLRVKHKCAVITEAHAGYASGSGGGRGVRPFGSSIFLRWPEFGYGLQASEGYEQDERPEKVDMVPWRGGREERNWPARLHRSKTLPWYPDNHSFFDKENSETYGRIA